MVCDIICAVSKVPPSFQPEELSEIFLTPAEERVLARNYESHLREFCKRFTPPMPRAVIGTAFHYFKRFYVHNSIMDFHPKEIL